MKILITITLCLTCLPCFSKEAKPERSCRIIYLERPTDAPTEAHLFDGVTSHKVSLSSMDFSEVVILPEGALKLGMTPNPVLSAENFPSGAPTIQIPATITDLYLVVVSDPENKVIPIRMLPLDVGVDKLKPGQTIWVNLTTHRIEAKLGNEKLEVPPSARVVGKAPLTASGYYLAHFAYQPQGQNDLLPIMKKSWWHDATSKNLGFIIDSGGRLPKIFTFRDHRTPDTADAQ